MDQPKKKSVKIKIYDKVIETEHPYDPNSIQAVTAALESNWKTLAYVDTKFRPNDKLEEVHTSHEFHALDVGGKLNIQFIFRNRNSSIRFHSDKIVETVNAVLGTVKPKAEKAKSEKKSSRVMATDPVPVVWDDNDVPELSDDDVPDDPILDEPELDDEDLHEVEDEVDGAERTYYDYKYWKESRDEKPNPKIEQQKESSSKPWVDSNTVTGFFIGAIAMKFMITGKL